MTPNLAHLLSRQIKAANTSAHEDITRNHDQQLSIGPHQDNQQRHTYAHDPTKSSGTWFPTRITCTKKGQTRPSENTSNQPQKSTEITAQRAETTIGMLTKRITKHQPCQPPKTDDNENHLSRTTIMHISGENHDRKSQFNLVRTPKSPSKALGHIHTTDTNPDVDWATCNHPVRLWAQITEHICLSSTLKQKLVSRQDAGPNLTQ